MGGEIRLRFDGPLARVTLRRPPLNVLTLAMLDELRSCIEHAGAQERVRLIRLDAEGKVFSAGVDVADHIGDNVAPMIEALTRLFLALDAAAPPTVSVVHGAALGGGCELALATDLCLASERASFGQPEIRLGLFAPPASLLLPRVVGERRALGLLLSGETIPATEAERIGVVNHVFAGDRFDAEVEQWLDRLLELSGAALRLAKRAVRVARGLAPSDGHPLLGRLYLDELMRTADAHEGPQAFMDKRNPSWKHA